MKKFLGTFVITLVLAGCSVEGLVDTAYPDRERFAFRSKDGESTLHYTCERKASKKSTKDNARRANAYFDGAYNKVIEEVLNDSVSFDQIEKYTVEQLEQAAEITEERYKCQFYDIRDV